MNLAIYTIHIEINILTSKQLYVSDGKMIAEYYEKKLK